MTLGSYFAFVGLALVLAITPGPDTLLVLRYALRDRRSGFAAATGSAIGNIVWAALVAVGLAALVEQSAELYRVLKIVGGLYLVYLGIQAIRHARRLVKADAAPASPLASRRRFAAVLSAGFLSCMTNPKVGLFFIAVLPQFVPHGESALATTMILGVTLSLVIFLYLAGLTLIADRANTWLNRPRVTKAIEGTSGGILVALGIGTTITAFEFGK